MASKASNLILVLSIILMSATVITSFDITKLLQKHGDFSTFNDLLTQTGLASDINSRKTITVLAVDNSGMGSISSKPKEVAKNILATHIILDYYDTKKLADTASSNKSSALINLFQASGAATGQQGSLRVTTSGKDVVLGSAVNGAPHDSQVVNSVEEEPYNISVLQISQPIVTPGLDQISPAQSPDQSPKKAKGKAPSSDDSSASAPAPSPSSDKGGAADDSKDEKKSPPTNEGAPRMTKVGGLVVPLLMGLGALTI